jgi:hypothetical protein
MVAMKVFLTNCLIFGAVIVSHIMFGTVHTVEIPQVVYATEIIAVENNGDVVSTVGNSQVVYATEIIAVENNGDVVSTVVIPGDVEVYYASTIDYSYTAYCGKNLTGIFYGDTVTFAVLPFLIAKALRGRKSRDSVMYIDEVML